MKNHYNIRYMLTAGAWGAALLMAGTTLAADAYSPFSLSTGKEAAVSKQLTMEKPSEDFEHKSLIGLKAATPSEDTSPFAGSEDQMKELDKMEPIVERLKLAVDAHNTLNQLGSYRNIQKRYNQVKMLHDKSIEILGESEQCTLNFIGRYFNNPVKVWSGINMSKNPENHDLRTGLSKWALEMFEMAKSAQVTPVSVGDLATVDETSAESFAKINAAASKDSSSEEDDLINTDMADLEATEIKDMGAAHAAAEKQAVETYEKNGGNYLKEPSKQEELEKETRKTDLMTNDVGSVVATWIADYLAGKTDAAGPEWKSTELGGVKKRFPVWNDQKVFYEQYLDRKYNNMRKYIEAYEIPTNLRKKVSDAVFNRQKQFMNQAEADITQAAYNAINTAIADHDAKVEEVRQKYGLDINTVNSKEAAEISALSATKQSKVTAIEEKIAEAKDERDALSTQLSDLTADKQDVQSQINDARQELARMESLLSGANLSAEQKAEYEQSKANIAAQISQLNNQIKELDKERSSLETQIAEQSEIIRRQEQEKSDAENAYLLQVNNIKAASQTEINAIMEAMNAEIKKLDDELEAKKTKIALAEKAAKATLGSNSTVTAMQIINESEIVFETAKDDAFNNINQTLTALKSLGDDLYRGQMQDTVSSYHQALIDSLNGKKSEVAALPLEPVGAKVRDISNFLTDIVNGIGSEMATLNISNYRSKVENTQVLLTVPAFDEMLKDVETITDSEYFVGSTPKARDFRAPKTMPDFNLPPLREYVRLDYVDLQSIAQDAPKLVIHEYREFNNPILDKIFKEKILVPVDGVNPVAVIDKEKFLNYGGRIPQIWKLMLKDKAFVESDFYLSKDMLPEGEETAAFSAPLSLGSEISPLYRGGVYPCVIKDSNCGGDVVVDIAKNGTNSSEHIMRFNVVDGDRKAEILQTNPPACREVAARCTKTLGNKIRIYLASLNDNIGLTPKGTIIADGAYSELGSILGVYNGKINGTEVKNVLAYTQDMQAVVNYGLRMEQRNDPNGDSEPAKMTAEEQQNDDIYVRAQYNINQIGDFLSHVEVEQDYKNALDEIEETLVTMKEELYEILRSYGFEPSPDFDISKEEDYQLAVNKIKAIKKSNTDLAKDSIISIEPGSSDLLYQSKNSYNRVCEGLYADSEAVNVMTMDVDNPTEFAEDIKTGTTNRNVDNRYEQEADNSFEEQMKSFKPVYCAAY